MSSKWQPTTAGRHRQEPAKMLPHYSLKLHPLPALSTSRSSKLFSSGLRSCPSNSRIYIRSFVSQELPRFLDGPTWPGNPLSASTETTKEAQRRNLQKVATTPDPSRNGFAAEMRGCGCVFRLSFSHTSLIPCRVGQKFMVKIALFAVFFSQRKKNRIYCTLGRP